MRELVGGCQSYIIVSLHVTDGANDGKYMDQKRPQSALSVIKIIPRYIIIIIIILRKLLHLLSSQAISLPMLSTSH